MTTLIRSGLLLVLAAAAGCGGGTTSVSGKVAFQGKPVVYGTVVIVGADGVPKSGAIQPDGTYSVGDVKIGPAKVAVSSPAPPGAGPAAKPRGGKDAADDDGKVPPQPPAAAPPEVVKGWVPLPEKYGDPAKSDLKFDIASGQPLNIELK